MLAFEIDCGMAEEVRIESIRIASDGSGDEPVEIARVVLWEDANGDRILSPGLDRMIAVTDGPFSADNGILNLAGLTEVIPPGERRVWFLTIHLWGWSAAGKNFQLFFDVAAKDSPIQVVGVSGPIRPTGGLVIAPHAWVDPLVGSSGTQREDSALGLCGGSVAGHPLSFWSFVVLANLAVFWKRR